MLGDGKAEHASGRNVGCAQGELKQVHRAEEEKARLGRETSRRSAREDARAGELELRATRAEEEDDRGRGRPRRAREFDGELQEDPARRHGWEL